MSQGDRQFSQSWIKRFFFFKWVIYFRFLPLFGTHCLARKLTFFKSWPVSRHFEFKSLKLRQKIWFFFYFEQIFLFELVMYNEKKYFLIEGKRIFLQYHVSPRSTCHFKIIFHQAWNCCVILNEFERCN